MPRPLLKPSQQQKRYIISASKSKKHRNKFVKQLKGFSQNFLNNPLQVLIQILGIVTLIALTILILPFLTLMAMILWKVGTVVLILLLGATIMLLL